MGSITGRTSGVVHYTPSDGLMSDEGYRIVAEHLRKHLPQCPSCHSKDGFSVAEHLHIIPGFKMESAHTVVLVMCNSCYELRAYGAVKMGIDR